MNEGLEEPKTEEIVVEVTETPAPGRIAWIRFAYASEFLLALICVFTLWSQVGGQGHLDLLPWYVKLVCALAMSWGTVRCTAGIVEEEKPWNKRTRRWLFGIGAVALAMAAITYYYHLHEALDEPDTDETSTAASVSAGHPSRSPWPI